jgi:hypothetical protein
LFSINTLIFILSSLKKCGNWTWQFSALNSALAWPFFEVNKACAARYSVLNTAHLNTTRSTILLIYLWERSSFHFSGG